MQLNYWAEPTGTSGNPVNLLPPGFRTTPIRQGVRTQESPFNPETTTLRPPGFRTTPTRQGVQESLFNPATTTLRPPLRYGTRDILASVSAEQAASKRPYDEFLRGEPATHYGGDFDFLNAENRKQVTNARQHDQARQRAEDALDEERRNQEGTFTPPLLCTC